MSATSIDLSQIKTDALSAASTFRTLIGLGTSDTPTFKAATLSAGTLNGTVLDIAQTWGGTGTYTGIKYNVTDSGPSNAASLLMDLQVGGVSRARFDKNGSLTITGPRESGNLISATTTGYSGFSVNYAASVTCGNISASNITWSGNNGGDASYVYTPTLALRGSGSAYITDCLLTRDAAGILAQRNSTSAQTFRLYNTTDAGLTNYERAKIAWESNVLRIGTEGFGTGAVTPRSMEFQTNGTTRLTIDGSTGAVILPTSSSTSSFLLRGAAYATTGININASGALTFSGSGSGLDLTVAGNVLVHNALQIGPSGGFTELHQAGSPSGTQTGVLEQRYTTCPQTYRIYATRTSSTNFERAKLEWATDYSVFRIGTEKGSGGGSAKPLEIQTDGTTRLTISTTGAFTIADALNVSVGTTTGTKIGTGTTQKLGFYNATPVVQPAAVADATDAASVITQLNLLLARMRDLGLIAT